MEIPIEIDEELLQAGIQSAIASRLEYTLGALKELVADIKSGGAIDRNEWDAAWTRLTEVQAEAAPLLEYARVFHDQWPSDESTTDDTTE